MSYILHNGNVYFLIQKDKLPIDVRKVVKGGDAEDKSYQSYAMFKDVYGITSDLKVYYCADGLESIIGTADEKLKDDGNRIAISSENSLSSALTNSYDWIKTDENGNILAENLENLREVSLENSTISDLSDIYNFSSMTKLIIKNSTVENMNGLEYATQLNYILIDNSIIGDYTGMIKAPKLVSLYFNNMNNNEFCIKLSNDFQNAKIPTLLYFGIRNSTFTSLTPINNFSEDIRGTLKYMYIQNNKITECNITNSFNGLTNLYFDDNNSIVNATFGTMNKLECLDICPNRVLKKITGLNAPKLWYVDADSANALEDLDFLSNSPLLGKLYFRNSHVMNMDFLKNNNAIYWIYGGNSYLGKGRDYDTSYNALGKNDNNVLKVLENKTTLRYLQLETCSYLGYVSYINNLSLSRCLLDSSNNILDSEFNIIKSWLKNVSDHNYPQKFNVAMLDSSTKTFKWNGDITLTEFNKLSSYPGLEEVIFKEGSKIMDGASELAASEYNSVVNTVCESLINVKKLYLGFANLTDISFLNTNNANNLVVLTLLGSKVGTHKYNSSNSLVVNPNGLQLLNSHAPKLTTLGLSRVEKIIDLSLIQPTINKLYVDETGWKNINRDGTLGSTYFGLVAWNQDALNTLAKCTNIEYFQMGEMNNSTIDLSKCTKLKKIWLGYLNEEGGNKTIILPNISTNYASDGTTALGFEFYLNMPCNLTKIEGGLACSKIDCHYPRNSTGSFTNEKYCGLFSTFKNSSYLKELNFRYTLGDPDTIVNWNDDVFDNFKNCTNLYKILYSSTSDKSMNLKEINSISNLTSLKEISFDGTNLGSIPDLSKLKSLEKISMTNGTLVDISKLSTAGNKLNTINFQNNSIGDLKAISGFALTNINLNTNSIKSTALNSTYGTVNNIEIINSFKDKILPENFDLRNNKLSDEDKVVISWITLK